MSKAHIQTVGNSDEQNWMEIQNKVNFDVDNFQVGYTLSKWT